MRTILTLLLFCFGNFQSQAQISTLHVKQGCSYDDALAEKDLYLYDPSNEAERIVVEIVDALGLVKNFTVRSSNVSNALATSFNGTRYIFYSTSFLEKFKADANTQWAAYSVLAHEIGHHLNGHNFGETDPRTRKMLELEADQFSGSVLRMLGATIDEAQAGLNTFKLQGETNSHPPPAARKEAVSNGWKKRDEWLRERGMTVIRKIGNTSAKTPESFTGNNSASAKEWYDKGKAEESDKYKKIEYFTKAIQINPNYTDAYNNRGAVKDDLKRYSEAIEDYTKAIQIDPNYSKAYYNRGLAKTRLKQNSEALSDFNNAIRLDPADGDFFYSRGNVKVNLAMNSEAIKDFDKAIQLDPKNAGAYFDRGFEKSKLGNEIDAIADYDESILLNPNRAIVYSFRGGSKAKIGKFNAAILDINKAIQLDPTDAYCFYKRGCIQADLGKHTEAIEDFERAIQVDPDYALAYTFKGRSLVDLGRYEEAVDVLNIALKMDSTSKVARLCKELALLNLGKN